MNKIQVMTIALLALVCFLFAGCSTNGMMKIGMVDEPGMATNDGVHGLITLGGLYTGSAIQWNEDYYVTARHIPMMSRSSHNCNCDLKFIKRKASQPLPRWREAREGEEIIAFGYSNKIPLSSKGNILGLPVIIYNEYSPKGKERTILNTLSSYPEYIVYQSHNAPIMSGMSGGAVISVETGEVLGMNVSLLKRRGEDKFNEENNLEMGDPVSIFIPYSMIQASWDNYQRMKQGKLRWLLPGQEVLRREYDMKNQDNH